MGTNIKAWLFTILRNEFYSQMRKRGRECRTARAPSPNGCRCIPASTGSWTRRLQEGARRAARRPARGHHPDRRLGFSYEEAAEICDCAVGTMKSGAAHGRGCRPCWGERGGRLRPGRGQRPGDLDALLLTASGGVILARSAAVAAPSSWLSEKGLTTTGTASSPEGRRHARSWPRATTATPRLQRRAQVRPRDCPGGWRRRRGRSRRALGRQFAGEARRRDDAAAAPRLRGYAESEGDQVFVLDDERGGTGEHKVPHKAYGATVAGHLRAVITIWHMFVPPSPLEVVAADGA